MLYAAQNAQRLVLDGISAGSGLLAGSRLPWISAHASLLHRMTRRYDKPPFAIPETREVIVASRPFAQLVHFVPDRGVCGPRVLVVAPLSGHHATLVRDTIATLLGDHDVYVTDWLDARDVPISLGAFSLDDYVAYVRAFMRQLDTASLHVVAVCQPTVPTLAAVALDAADGAPTPRSLVLMGGPVDASQNPTQVNRLATEHPLSWFEQFMIYRVPGEFAGRGRRVYPGFLQLTAFMMMNVERHTRSYVDYWFAQLGSDAVAAALHENFYDEYNAVLDMDAAYYLDTVRVVFQELALARGTWDVGGQRVAPRAITQTSVFTVEGELDDISGLGQTAAALALCSGVSEAQKRHLVTPGCGHYGLFSGSKWRTQIYPEVRAMIRASEGRRA